MPAEITQEPEDNRAVSGRSATPAVRESVAAERGPKPERPPSARRSSGRRKLLFAVLGAAVLAAIIIWGVPWIALTFSTVSTDDAYVSGHVTFVAPRVGGQVSQVLVEDNNRVRKGDLLA